MDLVEGVPTPQDHHPQPSRPGEAGAQAGLKFSAKLTLFVLLLILLDRSLTGPLQNGLVGSRFFFHAWLEEKTVLEYESLHTEWQTSFVGGDKIVMLGNSCVAHGVSPDLVAAAWRADGVGLVPLNCGMDGLGASELPLVQRFVLRPGVRVIVYIYNFWSVESTPGTAPSARWDVGQWLRYCTPRELMESLHDMGPGLLGQTFFVVRYKDVIRFYVTSVLGPLGPVESRKRTVALPTYGLTREERVSLAERGLRRFLHSARAAGVAVIIAPCPEPVSEKRTLASLDRRMAGIAEEEGASYLPRDDGLHAIEMQGGLFADPIHLGQAGNVLFSVWLGKRLAPFIAAPALRPRHRARPPADN